MSVPIFGAITGFMDSWLQAYMNKAISDAQGTIDNANTASQNLINQTNADAANQVRAANNGFVAAQASLSNLARSLSNQRKLDANADQENALTMNLVRLQDNAVQGSLDQQLKAAEQMGAVRAAAAANGVGGTTASMLQKTMALTAARARTQQDQNVAYQTYDMLRQRAGLAYNTIASLDEGQTFAPIDYNINVAPLVQSPLRASQFATSVVGQAWLGALNGLLGADYSTVGQPSSAPIGGGTIGNTPGYSSAGVLFGPSSSGITYEMPSASSYGVGADSYGFGQVGGKTNGFFSTDGSSASVQNFQLK
ncbi:virion core protein, T7 gp14 family [Burkholderia multivorans]|uniref:virion core protein, T7 gp14 family n=1 Tax=Burkholderia multivorans TaxID=87883 RepID=UPI0037363F28